MARLAKGETLTGTFDDLVFYKWEDRIFVRKKSSLTKERVLKDKAFAGLRKHAGDMGRASKIASEIYKLLPSDIKGRWIFRAIAGHAASLIYKGKDEQQVRDILHRKYVLLSGKAKTMSGSNETGRTVGKYGLIYEHSSKQANKEWKKLFVKRWVQQGKPEEYFDHAWHRGQRFMPHTIPRRSEYFFGLDHAAGYEDFPKKHKSKPR